MTRDEFLDVVYDELYSDGDNNRANRIIDAAESYVDEYAPHWIIVTDRLPEEREWIGTKKFGTTISDEVYVTFERPDGQRFTKHISFQNGKLSSSDKRLMEVWYDDAKPIAWMPLPDPYKGVTT